MVDEINKVIQIALAENGYLEKNKKYINNNAVLDSKTDGAGADNVTKYWRDIYPAFQQQAWCMCFCVWVMVKAFGIEEAKKRLFTNTFTYSCTQQIKYFRAKNQFFTTPQVGDLIFYKDSNGNPCHVGLIYKLDSAKIYTIEGNTSSAKGVVANGGSVNTKSYSKTYSRIYGFGRPGYSATNVGKTDVEIALEVLEGKWDNGAKRRQLLTQAGYDYITIQNIVNTMLKER